MPRPRPPAWQVLVAGGGIPSLAFGLALRRALGAAVAVTVLDPGRPSGGDPRAFAVSPAAFRMLDVLGVGATLRRQAQPIAAMTITDSRLEDAVRPEYLRFDGEPDGQPLALMLEGSVLSASLVSACRDAEVRLETAAVASFAADVAGVAVTDGAGATRQVSLLVAADGARSRLREAAGIGWTGRRYRQLALVATVSHEHPHGGVAVQHFLPGGPFAILPLAGPGRAHPHRSSLVWTEAESEARRLLAEGPEAATAGLRDRFGPALGAVALDTPLRALPLGVGLARRFVAPRLALLGDAAHEIHPLAGQGLNLGLGDAAALAEHVVGAVRLGLDPGSDEVLARYQTDRRFEAVALAGLTDALNRLFSNDSLPVRALRDLGLGLVDRAGGAKGFFAEEAAGGGRRAPSLMRGEAL
ncbi:FAD-dependent monooxygenase [Enterovirga sp.]|uniref:FAD-dependent monooxygenase n=1 Tax=Enterovirga sp. TaxID=2026350 RepID=UPI003453F8E9